MDAATCWEGQAGDWVALKDRVTYLSRAQVLSMAVALARAVPGHYMEFGSYQGHSVRHLRAELWRDKLWGRQLGTRIYACDSFRGLPEDYENLPAGTFATRVPTLRGIRIVEGFFEDSLTPQLAAEVRRVSLAHLDADLWSSTATALSWLTPLLGPGSLLLFDELLGEDPAEFKALQEWLEATNIRVAMIALFGREPSGNGERTDRRAIFQVVGNRQVAKAPPLPPSRVIRRLTRGW